MRHYGVRWRKTVVRAKPCSPHPPCKARSQHFLTEIPSVFAFGKATSPLEKAFKVSLRWKRTVGDAGPYILAFPRSVRGEVSLWRICLLTTHGSKLPCALLATCEPLFAHGAHLLILIFTAVCEGVRLDLPNKKGSTAWCSFLFGGSEGNLNPAGSLRSAA